MDCLNLDYHIKRLLLIAISRHKLKKDQAKALGISIETLNKYTEKYELKSHWDYIKT